MGRFVVRDCPGTLFSVESPDLKLKRSINRFSNGPGAPASDGKSGADVPIADFSLCFTKC